MTVTKPPKRRLRLKLKMQADDLASLTLALHRCATDLAVDGRTQCKVTSGGPTSGYQLKLTDRGEGQ